MNVVEIILWVLQFGLGLGLIFLVLIHCGKGGGLSDMFGGGLGASAAGSTVMEKNLDRITVVDRAAVRVQHADHGDGARHLTSPVGEREPSRSDRAVDGGIERPRRYPERRRVNGRVTPGKAWSCEQVRRRRPNVAPGEMTLTRMEDHSPYADKIDKTLYERQLRDLQIELLKLQR